VKNLENWKEVVGALLGAGIAVVWVSFAILGFLSIGVYLAIALTLTIMLGTLSGMLYASSKEKVDWKQAVGALLGATIGAVWASFAVAGLLSDRVFLVVAIVLTILLGTLSGGLYALSAKDKESPKT
jgi:uncharacterized membrane protein YfcA